MLDSRMDSDIEEIEPPTDNHRTASRGRKHSASPSFALDEWEEGCKRARSTSHGSGYSLEPEQQSDSDHSPFLQPVTSSFVFDPDNNQGSTPSTYANTPAIVTTAASTSAHRSVSVSASTPSVSANSPSAGGPLLAGISNPRPYTRPTVPTCMVAT
ncbi:hypothetical protein MVEN_02340500 [Mycena venus]|uniref:Uncharacterized protein n=1 Tax=Mycena venus TaxID=2733690 RepID=A0A8H7CET8_9AGAR|nr:hypothetical protein MVEN_02340500 [Mycena venus]